MSAPFATEVALGRALVPWLQARGVRCYHEVQIPGIDKAPDLIGVNQREGVLTIYEFKLHGRTDLIADAARWVGACHRSWAVAPMVSSERLASDAFLVFEHGLREVGAGLLLVAESGAVSPVVPARFTQWPRNIGILDALHDEHALPKTEAGTPSKRWTPRTAKTEALVAALTELLTAHPRGLRVTDALRRIAAPFPFAAMLRAGRVSGVVVERGRVKLAASEVAA